MSLRPLPPGPARGLAGSSWRPALAAAAITLGLFLVLPWLEGLTPTPEADLRTVPLTTAPPPPSPPRPPPPPEPTPAARPARPVPPAPELRPRVRPLPAPPLPGDSMGFDAAIVAALPAFAVAGPPPAAEMVFELADLDQPPHPRRTPAPLYPPAARTRRVEGMVHLEFIVGAEGQVEEVRVIESHPGRLFVDAAVRAVERWRFHPGTRRGEAVPVRVRQRLDFRLEAP